VSGAIRPLQTDYDFVDNELADFFRHHDLAAMNAGRPQVNEEEVTFADDGHKELLETIKTPMLNNEGELVGVLGIARDITDRRKTAELIEHQAAFDSLTDLPNRRLLIVRLNQSIANCNRHNYFSAVLFIDLDNFKNVNDSLGHPVGDELLKQVAKRMVSELREGDTASRLGGDEFVVLLMELSEDSVQAAELARLGAEKIRKNLSRSYAIDKNTLHITVSIGIALIPMENDSADDVLKFADTAMYHAKESGRNAIRFFLPRMQVEVDERLRLQNDLHQAMLHNELDLFFQPKINSELNIMGAEVLLRWNHPVRGNVAPDMFIPAAEKSGQILEIGQWVLKNSFIQMDSWAKQLSLPENFHIAINVSPHQFRQKNFIANIEQLLGETGVDPKYLTFELTEGVLVENIKNTTIKINSLKKLGIHFSIDDFGTGYSSLAYLKQLPVQELKIDRSFIRDINIDQSDASLVETIIMLASQFNLDVVAEGVEKVEQYKFLSAKGCSSYQGYFFERPMAEEAFTRLLINYPNYSKNIK
jgi:diguanylate cyclase (GGDEF)-like protein